MVNNNILSVFDGISTAQIALNKLGVRYNTYYASEIDRNAIDVTKLHFPKTVFLGDVKEIDGTKLQDIKLIIGALSCNTLTMDSLFWEFLRLKNETKAKYFLFENVNMKQNHIDVISNALGVLPIEINSSVVTPQNRVRLYWTNIPNVSIPENNFKLSDVIPYAISGAGHRGAPDRTKPKNQNGKWVYVQKLTVRNDFLANSISTKTSSTNKYINVDGEIVCLNPDEAEVLQTIEKGYTNINNISKSERFELIGNASTVDVILNILKGVITKKNKYNLFFR